VFYRLWNVEPSHGIFPLAQNFDISVVFHGILYPNFAEVENSLAVSTIFDLLTYFCHEKNQTGLPKAVGPTNSYCNMAQNCK